MKTLIAAAALGGLLMASTPVLAQEAAPDEHADHAAMPEGEAGHDMSEMAGALGSYRMTREASGTAWQPDSSTHEGVHITDGRWTYMAHVTLDLVADWQGGRRGDDKRFLSGMVMASAQYSLPNLDTLKFRAMLSPDPFMGKRGYPLLLASGETADGVNVLVDRQHPHDLFMELSASFAHHVGERDSLFVYGGLPGEPAFGPPAFMHRQSILDSPEAPISHHWLDSTHITFGVVTAGWVHDDWKLEASRFHGREPDEHRYDIETGALDSTAVRLSWNPSANLALQGSWARVKSPEQLEPDADATRWSASAMYTVALGAESSWATTAAWGRRRATGDENLDAFVIESAFKPNRAWTVFARAERTETDELASAAGGHGPVFKVAKASLGVVRDFVVHPHASVGIGGLFSLNAIPDRLEPLYGGDPTGGMVFLRLKVH
jgi:hypothetical protein